MEEKIFRVAISHRSCRDKDNPCNRANCDAVADALKLVCDARKVKYEYYDWDFNKLGLHTKEDIEKYFLEKADLAVFIIEGKFGDLQRRGYGEILKRKSPEMLPYVLIRKKHEEQDRALLEEARNFKLDDKIYDHDAYEFSDTSQLKGLFLDHLKEPVERFKESQEVRDVTETESGAAENPQIESVPEGTEQQTVSTQPGGDASSAGNGGNPGRGKVLAVVAALVILAILAILLAPVYRPLLNGSKVTEAPADSVVVPIDTLPGGSSVTPDESPIADKEEPENKGGTVPSVRKAEPCRVLSKDGDHVLESFIREEIQKCPNMNLTFPVEGRTAWIIEIKEYAEQPDSTKAGYITHVKYTASIQHNGEFNADLHSENCYGRDPRSGAGALSAARELARSDIAKRIIEKLMQ